VPFISLPNLILGEQVFPEFLQREAEPEALAAAVARWIPDTDERRIVLAKLAALPGLLGSGGVTDRAANIILECMHTKP
jgi:lipid-A-disaccharide synthase